MEKVNDESYWSQYYNTGAAPDEPSKFARYIMDHYLKAGKNLVELGCGNGRDAHFFATNGVNVSAIDQCASEIDELVKSNGRYDNLHYVVGDFTELPDSNESYDVIYSRFTLHSVSAEGQAKTLKWCAKNLAEGGLLCIETRGQKNELYKKGQPVSGEIDAFIYEDHYRRFVELYSFKEEIAASALQIVESNEQTGFAPFKDTDYNFIRIIAKK